MKNNVQTWILCVLVVGAMSCSPKNEFHIDRHFTADECDAIRIASTDWQIATKEQFQLVFDEDVDGDTSVSKREIIRAYSRSYVVRQWGDDVKDGLGFRTPTWPGENIVMIVDRIYVSSGAYSYGDETYMRAFRRIIRHELGHHLGAKHVAVSGSIMESGLPNASPECIDSATVDSYCDNNDGCDRQQMRGCPLVTEEP